MSSENEPRPEEDSRDPQQPSTAEEEGQEQRESTVDTADPEPLTIDKLKAELEAANEKVVRAHADLENYRKRSRREAEERARYAAVPIMRDLVNVLDNLTRAIEAGAQSNQEDNLRDGVRLVADQLNQVMETHGCQRIETVGHPFDPNFHESIQMVESDEYPPGTVTQEVQTGYRVHDRVVRPAKVIVSSSST